MPLLEFTSLLVQVREVCVPVRATAWARGRRHSLPCAWVDLTLVVPVTMPCFGGRGREALYGIQLSPSRPVCRPSKGQLRLSVAATRGTCPLGCPSRCVCCHSVKHLPGQPTGSPSWADAHTFSTQGAGVEEGKVGGWVSL